MIRSSAFTTSKRSMRMQGFSYYWSKLKRSKLKLALNRHLLRVEVLCYRQPPKLGQERNAFVLGRELIGLLEHKHDGGESALLRQQVHAGRAEILLALALQECVLLQLEGQRFLIDIHSGNI